VRLSIINHGRWAVDDQHERPVYPSAAAWPDGSALGFDGEQGRVSVDLWLSPDVVAKFTIEVEKSPAVHPRTWAHVFGEFKRVQYAGEL